MRERCPCGCGQATAQTTRLRLCRCDQCGCPVRITRSWIERGACGTCGCGGRIVPECLEDRIRMPDDVGAEAWAEYMGRETEFQVRSERARKAAATRSRRAAARKAPRPDHGAFRPDHTGHLVAAGVVGESKDEMPF